MGNSILDQRANRSDSKHKIRWRVHDTQHYNLAVNYSGVGQFYCNVKIITMLTCSFKPIFPCRVASLGINFYSCYKYRCNHGKEIKSSIQNLGLMAYIEGTNCKELMVHLNPVYYATYFTHHQFLFTAICKIRGKTQNSKNCTLAFVS